MAQVARRLPSPGLGMDGPSRSNSKRPSTNQARRSDGRRPSRPEFQMPDLPKQVQGGLGIVGHTGDLFVTCPPPTQRRVSTGEPHKAQAGRKSLGLAGASVAAGSPPQSARAELPPLPWSSKPPLPGQGAAALTQRSVAPSPVEDTGAGGGGGGDTGSAAGQRTGQRTAWAPAGLDSLDDAGNGEAAHAAPSIPTPRLSPASQIKFKSLDSTLSKLEEDHDRAGRLWHLARDKVAAMNSMKSCGSEPAAELLADEGDGSCAFGLGMLGNSTGASDSTAAGTSCEGSEGSSTAAGATSSSATVDPLGLSSHMADGATGGANAGNAGNAGKAASGSSKDSSGHSGRNGADGTEEGAGRDALARSTSAGRDLASAGRGDSRRPSRRKTTGSGEKKGSRSRRPSPGVAEQDAEVSSSKAHVLQDEKDEEPHGEALDPEDVDDSLLDEFLQELFARYSSTKDNRGRPLLNNMGTRRFLQDFSLGPGCKPSSAAVCRVVAQADVLYDEELERQQNMSFAYDLSKGEAGRGLCYKAFDILLKQVKLPCSSKEMSRRWFVRYSVGVTAASAVNVADAMYMDVSAMKCA